MIATRPEQPVLRSAVFAASSVTLAAVAHILGGGASPRACVVLAATGLLVLLGLAAGREERSGWQIAALVLSTQLVLHVAFMLTAPATATGTGLLGRVLICHSGPRPVDPALTDAVRRSIGQVAAAGAGQAGSHSTAGMLPMLMTHLLAAGFMAFWLRRGERAIWAAARRSSTRSWSSPPSRPWRNLPG